MTFGVEGHQKPASDQGYEKWLDDALREVKAMTNAVHHHIVCYVASCEVLHVKQTKDEDTDVVAVEYPTKALTLMTTSMKTAVSLSLRQSLSRYIPVQ